VSTRGERIAGIRERVASATPGPWDAHVHASAVWPLIRVGSPENVEADAVFIEHARDDIPFLLAEVDRLTAECVTARTVYVVLDRDWGETPAMISIHTTLAGGVAAAAKYNRKTGDHFDIEERTVDGEEAGDE